jgi:predicted MFS family arabinose efflux permease
MAFLFLTAVGGAAVMLIWVAMPETRPPQKPPTHAPDVEKAMLPA